MPSTTRSSLAPERHRNTQPESEPEPASRWSSLYDRSATAAPRSCVRPVPSALQCRIYRNYPLHAWQTQRNHNGQPRTTHNVHNQTAEKLNIALQTELPSSDFRCTTYNRLSRTNLWHKLVSRQESRDFPWYAALTPPTNRNLCVDEPSRPSKSKNCKGNARRSPPAIAPSISQAKLAILGTVTRAQKLAKTRSRDTRQRRRPTRGINAKSKK